MVDGPTRAHGIKSDAMETVHFACLWYLHFDKPLVQSSDAFRNDPSPMTYFVALRMSRCPSGLGDAEVYSEVWGAPAQGP